MQTLNFLKDSIGKVRICLVIDNALDNLSFLEEAKTYLTLPFAKDNLVLVTARSIDVMRKLKISSSACMRIPTLKRNEVIFLFSHHTSCDISNLSSRGYDTLEKLVEQCPFQVEDMSTSEYHPLALKVLGSQVGVDIEGWQHIVRKHCSTENIHPIFSILRSSYDLLRPQYQRMYLDLALYQLDRKHYCYAMWRYVHGERDKNFMLKLVSFHPQHFLVVNCMKFTIAHLKSFFPYPNTNVMHRGNTKYFNTNFINGIFGVVLIFKLVYVFIFVIGGFGYFMTRIPNLFNHICSFFMALNPRGLQFFSLLQSLQLWK